MAAASTQPEENGEIGILPTKSGRSQLVPQRYRVCEATGRIVKIANVVQITKFSSFSCAKCLPELTVRCTAGAGGSQAGALRLRVMSIWTASIFVF